MLIGAEHGKSLYYIGVDVPSYPVCLLECTPSFIHASLHASCSSIRHFTIMVPSQYMQYQNSFTSHVLWCHCHSQLQSGSHPPTGL